MAVKQELEVTISETGEVTINVQGAKGKSCMEMSRELEEALGLVSERQIKSSYYEQEDAGRVRMAEEDGK